MDLSSLQFLFLFLPVFAVIYLFARKDLRLWLIVIASLVFLTWGNSIAVRWLGGILFASYGFGLLLPRAKEQKRAFWLWVGLGVNVVILLYFKVMLAYGPSLQLALKVPTQWSSLFASPVVPLGLSYVTFQAISYLADVWKGTIQPERNLLRFAAYLLFFPKLVSGPLMRYKPFLEQSNELDPSFETIAGGIRRVFIGFIKRALVANQAALIANSVFNLGQPNVAPAFAWLGLVAYTIQIYFDFSGYTDMAVGLGMMIGIQLPENFNFPYISQSVSEFWRRWHMTLSVWFREYVFFPLERRRFKWMGQQINILIVFLLTGLWHGVKPTFIAWGLWYGIFLVIESLGFGRWLSRAWRPLRHIYTLTVVMAGWVFFRASSLGFAWGFFRRLAGNVNGLRPLPFYTTTPLPFLETSILLALAVGILFSMPISSMVAQWRSAAEKKYPQSYLAYQITADVLLVTFFVLGLAATLSQSFLPNIYATF
ncbi:MAG: MBOAT family protein [Chloroflexi bacterium]|nr:MBOAT family protein [Chloroflexota bacterium]